MGLDQYAYIAAKHGERDEFYEQDLQFDGKDWIVPPGGMQKPREVAYWRKHPNLQGWMEQLWIKKGRPGVDPEFYKEEYAPDFNGIELELTWEDIDELEKAVKKRKLPATKGFFFGDSSDQHYYEADLNFIKNARAELFLGLRVFYNSSW
jgi:hypothetical protein